ncbi:MAG TPA: TrmH family RNA methyltransferase [Candidatus Paceibacterota bacterium]|nr:TrmH family RNA methyltransferase [Candidatus Paceibacterota bacterium]
MKQDVRILLHDIRSVYNVGAIFRTADAIGASKIYLSGYSPTPVDRFDQPRADFAKCALGSEKTVPWEYAKMPGKIIADLKKEGFEVIALEQNAESRDYKKLRPGAKVLVVFGNEVSGVSKSILSKTDVIAEIPMRGKKESLNVSVSAGIALFRWFDRA